MKRLFLVMIIIVTTSLTYEISAQNEKIADSTATAELNPNLAMINSAREFSISFLDEEKGITMFDETIGDYHFFSRHLNKEDGTDIHVFFFKDINDSYSQYYISIYVNPKYPDEISVSVQLSSNGTIEINDGNKKPGVKAWFDKNTGEFLDGDIQTAERILFSIKKFKERYEEVKS